MKKRLLSLLMCALIIISAFVMAACSDDEGALEKLGGEGDENATTSSNDEMTICIYSIRSPGTSDEAIQLVEEALSNIAVRKYNTKIDLILIDEEDYAATMFAKVKKSIAAYNSALLKNTALSETEQDKIAASYIDYVDNTGDFNYGVKEESNISTEVSNGTLDIFLCYTPKDENGNSDNGRLYTTEPSEPLSMFEILVREDALAPVTTYLESAYADLNNVLYTHALNYVTRGEDVYGVPNNYVYGNYDYIVFNDSYVSEFTSPGGHGGDKTMWLPTDENTGRITDLINNLNNKRTEITANPSHKDYAKWNEVYIPSSADKIPTFDSYENFEQFVQGKGYDFDGDGVKETDYKNFAIARISGSKSLSTLLKSGSFENFDVYVESANAVENPDEFCDSMFCIGRNALGTDKKGERIKRSLDILRLINTNKEFRNILQYGVKDIHYSQFSEDEDVIPLNGSKPEEQYTNIYPEFFGNNFLLYPCSTMNAEDKLMAKDDWQLSKDQIIELVPWLQEKHD